jgi:hypothetical protein
MLMGLHANIFNCRLFSSLYTLYATRLLSIKHTWTFPGFFDIINYSSGGKRNRSNSFEVQFMAEDIKTVRQMIAYLRQQLEALGFVMSFLSFHPSDDQAQHHQPQPMIYHVINLAGYHPSKALIVGVRFMGGPEGLSITQPAFDLLGQLKLREGVYPGHVHEELEKFGQPLARMSDFQLQINERTLGN